MNFCRRILLCISVVLFISETVYSQNKEPTSLTGNLTNDEDSVRSLHDPVDRYDHTSLPPPLISQVSNGCCMHDDGACEGEAVPTIDGIPCVKHGVNLGGSRKGEFYFSFGGSWDKVKNWFNPLPMLNLLGAKLGAKLFRPYIPAEPVERVPQPVVERIQVVEVQPVRLIETPPVYVEAPPVHVVQRPPIIRTECNSPELVQPCYPNSELSGLGATSHMGLEQNLHQERIYDAVTADYHGLPPYPNLATDNAEFSSNLHEDAFNRYPEPAGSRYNWDSELSEPSYNNFVVPIKYGKQLRHIHRIARDLFHTVTSG